MESYPNVRQMPYAPTETADLYPESDGKPMADTDLHIQWIIWLRQVLEGHFAQRPEVYISGNIMMYDIEGPLRTAVFPDILVSFGIGQKDRRTYRNDLEGKVAHYAAMGIPEYFLYDVDRRYLPTPLMGFRLVEDAYIEVSPDVDDGLRSEVLNLNFHLLNDGLGVYEPVAGKWLQTPADAATARAERAETRAERAETRAEQAETRVQHEAEARQKAEAEASRLREELARLKTR